MCRVLANSGKEQAILRCIADYRRLAPKVGRVPGKQRRTKLGRLFCLRGPDV